MRKIALITGATAGIGKATANLLAKNNFDIIITGRRKDRLEALKAEVEKEYSANVLALNFDVTDSEQVEKAIDAIPQKWKKIDVLINNAGLALGFNSIQDGSLDDWEKMIDTNIKGLLYVTKKIIPGMIDNKSGHIVNIGSIAGKEVYSNGNVYCSTKHAVDALTKALRIDLVQYGIRVSQVAPGMVNTEFSTVRFHGDKERADKTYQGFTPLSADDIADLILYIVTRPSHVQIGDVLITPTAQAAALLTKKDNQ